MAGSRRHIKMEETQIIRDLAGIMAAGPGPFTKKMLAEQLHKIYPYLSKQELFSAVSGAIQGDRYAGKRFKIAKPGWWDLTSKENPDAG